MFRMICGAVCLCGCGKKEAPKTSSAPPQPTSAEPAAPNPPAAASAPAAPVASYDTQVMARSIDYLKTQVARKNWEQARQALTMVESRPLTPAQRQYVDSLKAQMPPGK